MTVGAKTSIIRTYRSTNGCPMAIQPSVKKEKLDDVQMCYSKGYSGKFTICDKIPNIFILFYNGKIKLFQISCAK